MAYDDNRPTWVPATVSDTTADSSSKTFTVPANKIWAISYIRVDYTATVSVGTRILAIEFQTAAGVIIAEKYSTITMVATNHFYYQFGINLQDIATAIDTTKVQQTLPYVELPPSYIVKIYDKAAIAAAADDMLVYMTLVARPSL